MKQLNVALIGFGNGGKHFHAPIITSIPKLHLHTVVTSDPEKQKMVHSLYPNTQVSAEIDSVLNNPDIDLVVISIPNQFHYHIAKKALEADKHVVLDKPFTVNTDEAEQLITLAKKQEKLLTVYQNRRFDSDFLTVQSIINQGLLGHLVEYEVHFDRFRPHITDRWREQDQPGSGMLYDLGSHLIDQALVLFGIPESMTADLRIQRPGGQAIDYFQLTLNYNDLKVSLFSGMLVKEVGPHFILKGDKGSFIKYGMDPQEDLLKQGIFPHQLDNWGVESEDNWGSLSTDWNGLNFKGKVESKIGDYRIFYDNVAEAILNKEELLVKPEEARNVIKIIELAYQSHKEQRTILIDPNDF